MSECGQSIYWNFLKATSRILQIRFFSFVNYNLVERVQPVIHTFKILSLNVSCNVGIVTKYTNCYIQKWLEEILCEIRRNYLKKTVIHSFNRKKGSVSDEDDEEEEEKFKFRFRFLRNIKNMFKPFLNETNKLIKTLFTFNKQKGAPHMLVNIGNSIVRNCKQGEVWERAGQFLGLKCTITNEKMIALVIFLLLLSQGVEGNPGPQNMNIEIVTYNCNGLGDQRKLRRLLTKLDKKVKNGAIVFLQETHIVKTAYLDSIWKNKYLSNGVRTNSAGVIILFNEKYEVKYEFNDNNGRQITAVLSYDGKNIIVSNAYFPNDHKEGIMFAESIYSRILEAQAEYPDSLIICAGDFNACLSPDDSIGRVGTQNEKLLADVIRNNNKVTGLIDAYRSIHKKEGFTWNRGDIYSRLDYIFISSHAIQLIADVKTDWAFESSDHAAILLQIQNEDIKKGPGIIKVNANILEDPKITEEITNELKEMMSQTDDSWNPHATLEFLKVSIRSIFAAKVSGKRKQTRNILSEKEEELSQMETLKIKIYTNQNIADEERSVRVNITNRAIENLKTSINILRKELNDKMTFYSKAKWFEYGEKSNKYFLNLNKHRQNQKLINKITDGEKQYFGHEQTSKGITNFYKELYAKNQKTNQERDPSFYDNCPKLSTENKDFMDKELSITELKEALNSCKDSAPGPDGIPYSVYKKMWAITGPIILNSWNHSLMIGKLPPSHLESVITLLPKEGKNTDDIKNWRPITLSNCDAKIITKAISIKASKVLDTIIDVSQTAYVPGRSITDNLRSNTFYKNYCKQNNVDAVLISLDAKKAFDSVDHKYIEETLKAYGFGPTFLNVFKTLYNEITARILINGFMSEKIRIERGVKQGDALSCALFIICIDPLLRNLNKNKNIKKIKIKYGRAIKKEIDLKAAAYADDISVICENENNSIQMVFNEYERLTRLSGLELNADKTEILVLNKTTQERMTISYNKNRVNIESVSKLKICGIYFCNDRNEEYKLNVLDKIDKLSYKIKSWIPRHLTMEGKSLIVKTFGLSQIIYNMQACCFENSEFVMIERIIFRFLWSTSDNHNGIDRIKRSIMKNEYKHGGMKITDVESLNRSLKLRQFIRAQKSNHVISRIQNSLTNDDNIERAILQEYCKITSDESICNSAQESINLITDYNRRLYESISEDNMVIDKHLINEVSSINLSNYLRRKNHIFMTCMLKPLTANGIITLGDLIQNYEFEMEEKTLKTMRLIMSVFPKKLIEISKCFVEGINDNSENVKYIRTEENTWKHIDIITVKELQNMMKTILKKTEVMNFNQKLEINNFHEDNIIKLRSKCQNAKFRNLYFRLIHNDFFTHVRMKKYNMSQTDSCPRCGMTETSRHLLFECVHAKNIWDIHNQIISDYKVTQYENLFQINDSQCDVMIKMKIIQELIQIERPRNWKKDKVDTLIKNLMEIERFNAYKQNKIMKFNKIWKKYEKLVIT